MYLLPAALAAAAEPAKPPSVRFLLHGNMGPELPSEEFLRFVERVKPDVLLTGAFDQRLYAAAVPGPKSKAVPLIPADHLEKWKQVADRLHRSGIRLVAQVELFVVSDRPAERDEASGWFGYFDKQWDEKLLGPRPAKSAAELLEEPDLDRERERRHRYRGPVRLPRQHEGAAAAASTSRPGARRRRPWSRPPSLYGVDGFITNRNYFDHCACAHCRRSSAAGSATTTRRSR